MIRKQVYIHRRHQAMLERLAKLRQVSEAEVVRQAIEREAASTPLPQFLPDHAAWKRAHQLMLKLHAQGPMENQSRDWIRADLYEE